MKLCKLLCLLILSLIISSLFIAHAKGELDAKEARKLIAHLAGIELPSDAVRVKEVSPLGSSAVVVAQVETAFRFVKGDDGKWRVAEIRTGNNRWEDVDMIVRAVNAEKAERARAELETMATALEAFRRERGFYVEAKDAGVLVDQLNPRYLARIIRIDPWHNPYNYEGTRQGFTLRSNGADGKAGTGDDVTLNNQK
ncbi:MAG: type II secretion system protein GspG [Pyrinomonadaceae bacterium]